MFTQCVNFGCGSFIGLMAVGRFQRIEVWHNWKPLSPPMGERRNYAKTPPKPGIFPRFYKKKRLTT